MELLDPVMTMTQISAGTPKFEPMIDLVGKPRDEVIVYHFRGLAKIRDVFAGVPAGFGNEITKML